MRGSRTECAVSPYITLGHMHGGEDHGDVQFLGRARAGFQPHARAIVAFAFQPEPVEQAQDRLCLGAIQARGSRPSPACSPASPRRAAAPRRRRAGVVMLAALLLPDIERRLAPMPRREIQVGAQQGRGISSSAGTVQRRAHAIQRSSASARSARPSCCGRGQLEISSVPSGLTRVSPAIASPWAAPRSASVRRNWVKSGADRRRGARARLGHQLAAVELRAGRD